MFKTVSDEVFLGHFLDVVKQDENIRLVAMNGSRTNPHVRQDEFQDYDLVLILAMEDDRYIRAEWMSQFGTILVHQIPMMDSQYDDRAILVQYDCGQRIDLTIMTLDKLPIYLESDTLINILLDKDQRIDSLANSSDQGYWISKPSAEDFSCCLNEFWWVSMYVMKGLVREEYFYSAAHQMKILMKELLRVVGWKIALQHQWQVNLGKDNKFMASYLDEADYQQLLMGYNCGTKENLMDAFLSTLTLFQETTFQLAKLLEYPLEDYRLVDQKIRSTLSEYVR